MAQKLPAWVKFGCGGCGVLLILAIAVPFVTGYAFKGALDDFERADATMAAVEERYGPVAEYRADPTGVIPPERVEAFLAAREQFSEARERTERSLRILSSDRDEHDQPIRFASVRRLGAGASLLGRLSRFVQDRHDAMIDAEIGLGEYTYLYNAAYYSLLGKSPETGPSFVVVGENGYLLEDLTPLSERELREYRFDAVRGSLNRMLLPVLRNQLADAEALGPPPELVSWTTSLASEIDALEADAYRVPWQDGLPAPLAASLEPFADRLEATYAEMSNAVDIGITRR